MATVIATAKVFRNGGSQAIRLPRQMRVAGKEVIVRQDFGVISILPKASGKGSLLELLRRIGPIELAPRNQPRWGDRRRDAALRAARRRPRSARGR